MIQRQSLIDAANIIDADRARFAGFLRQMIPIQKAESTRQERDLAHSLNKTLPNNFKVHTSGICADMVVVGEDGEVSLQSIEAVARGWQLTYRLADGTNFATTPGEAATMFATALRESAAKRK